jgi:hypothetical protein
VVPRNLHIVHLLIRQYLPGGQDGFLVFPHEHWQNENGQPILALPAKKTVAYPLDPLLQGTSIEAFVDRIVHEELGHDTDSYALEQELEPTELAMPSPTHGGLTDCTIDPIDLWIHPNEREPLRARLDGEWLSAERGRVDPRLSPTARAVFKHLPGGDARALERCRSQVSPRTRRHGPCTILAPVADQPTMDALALKWLAHNRGGVRHLDKKTLDTILGLGDRAFNLRVADPYLPYQMQGVGFTWSFFTHRDPPDCHVHRAPVVELYGVLEGSLEVWWKPYYERGTSAWSHRVLQAGDWLEVDSLQCHIVHWLTEGKGVVLKAGPGPLAEVGRLGVSGKTPCTECPCMKPSRVRALELPNGQSLVQESSRVLLSTSGTYP